VSEPNFDLKYLFWWHEALKRQQGRVEEAAPETDRVPDGLLFVSALNNLHRAVRLCGRHADGALDRAIAEFEKAFPQIKDMRDVIEHFDDYEQSKGKLQDRGTLNAVPLAAVSGSGSNLRVQLLNLAEVNVREVVQAAEQIVGETLSSLVG
jgi:hypothetical protein